MYRIFSYLLIAIYFSFCPLGAFAQTRIKDIASIEDVRENFVMGYGLVTGLAGTGDNLRNVAFTKQELVSLLDKLGISVQGANLRTRNVAAVIVTASLPSFARPGTKMDVRVSALGDASSLANGVLLPTTLFGPDGVVYALAQGVISVQRFTPSAQEVRTLKSEVLTNGLIQGGAIVETGIDFQLKNLERIRIILNSPDFTTAMAITDAINDNLDGNLASALDSGTVNVVVKKQFAPDLVQLISKIETICIKTDSRASVVLNEVNGTVVMGGSVRIKPVAIAQGNLLMQIGLPKKNNQADRSRGIGVKALDKGGATLSEVVAALNQLGVLPKDLIDIMRGIKAAGALDASIEVSR
jgi:flagellar P-ring protein FlgI